jgi:hypothetical protein
LVRAATARRRPSSHRSPRSYGVGRSYRRSLRSIARRVIVGAVRVSNKRDQPIPSKKRVAAKLEKGRPHLYSYLFKRRVGIAIARAEAARQTVQLNLQRTQRKTAARRLSVRILHRITTIPHDRRKRQKRRRVQKRPGLRRGIKQRLFSRQLIRKLRSVQRAATRALRRRLLRQK